jgi:hypothetical protein
MMQGIGDAHGGTVSVAESRTGTVEGLRWMLRRFTARSRKRHARGVASTGSG